MIAIALPSNCTLAWRLALKGYARARNWAIQSSGARSILWWKRPNAALGRDGSRMITVAAGILKQDGRILICQRKSTGAFPLQWEFPGGKVEAGEDVQSCL